MTGSVSKGLADEFSDMELVFYVSELPGIPERDAWLCQVEAVDIIHDEDATDMWRFPHLLTSRWAAAACWQR